MTAITPEKEAALLKLRTDFDDNSNQNQRLLLLGALKNFPVSTSEARNFLGINSPAPRVLELRQAGYGIGTRLVYSADSLGTVRRFAEYFLESCNG
ncbi:MAG TPA: helix-turn-helix domain-containing protein [Methylotenera sp.]|nr:helix-turn-helix domain-containing protein [Methylotenera sp.]HPH06110.1 helix-turn-helix domain-containing protein [Methylotenera sp.]